MCTGILSSYLLSSWLRKISWKDGGTNHIGGEFNQLMHLLFTTIHWAYRVYCISCKAHLGVVKFHSWCALKWCEGWRYILSAFFGGGDSKKAAILSMIIFYSFSNLFFLPIVMCFLLLLIPGKSRGTQSKAHKDWVNNIIIIIIVSIGYSYCVSYRIDYIGIDYIKVLISLTLL